MVTIRRNTVVGKCMLVGGFLNSFDEKYFIVWIFLNKISVPPQLFGTLEYMGNSLVALFVVQACCQNS